MCTRCCSTPAPWTSGWQLARSGCSSSRTPTHSASAPFSLPSAPLLCRSVLFSPAALSAHPANRAPSRSSLPSLGSIHKHANRAGHSTGLRFLLDLHPAHAQAGRRRNLPADPRRDWPDHHAERPDLPLPAVKTQPGTALLLARPNKNSPVPLRSSITSSTRCSARPPSLTATSPTQPPVSATPFLFVRVFLALQLLPAACCLLSPLPLLFPATSSTTSLPLSVGPLADPRARRPLALPGQHQPANHQARPVRRRTLRLRR